MVELRPLLPTQRHTQYVVDLLNKHRHAFYSDQTITVQDHQAFLEHPNRQNEYNWLIVNDHQFCGMVGVYNINRQQRRCEWGRFIVDPPGQGIGRQVEAQVIQFVFEDLHLHKLSCEVLADNLRVIQLHLSFGFQLEGIYRQHVFKGGRYQDVVALALLNPIE